MGEIVDLPLDLIDPGPNVRTTVDDDADHELAGTIATHGVIQPIRVRRVGERYRVITGHRRVNASIIAGVATIRSEVLDGPPDEAADSIEQLIENVQRSDLNPIDLANAIEAALAAEPGLTAAALAERLGKSAPWISNHRRLLRLDRRTQRMVAEGTISMAAAKTMVNRSPEERRRLVQLATDGANSRVIEHESRQRGSQIRSLRLPVVAGWFVELSWSPGDDAGRLDIVSGSQRYEGGVRIVAEHARKLAAALRQLADVLDQQDRRSA